MQRSPLSRRGFLQGLAGTGAALGLSASSWSRVFGANERLRVVSVGTGGKGRSDLAGVAASPAVDIVGLCNIDESAEHLGWAVKRFSSARTYTDWRRLIDDAKNFDAIIVSTPDHMHAPIALPAMMLGKHVFCQKPLTHTVFEARQMRRAAEKFNLVTQMGNQIHSHEFYRTAVKIVHDGLIGKVKEVHSWQSGKQAWMLANDRPTDSDPVPAGVHWDLWLGAAPERPFKEKLYHAFNWRAWQDFSNGQLGDFGCHILDPVFSALELTAPTSVRGESSALNREVWYQWSVVQYEFPGTAHTAGRTLSLTWYDGEGRMPPLDKLGLPAGTDLPRAGSILIGEKASLVIPHVRDPQILVAGKPAEVKYEKLPSVDHYTSWADACRGVGKTGCPFDYAGPLTEAVLLGTVAIRRPGETLTWDAANMRIANSTPANALLTKTYRRGWEPKWL